MKDGGPSLTALQVAAARAAHLLFDPSPHLLEDRFALDLLGAEHAPMLDGYRDGTAWMLLENRVSIPLRARYVEDRLREAYARGVRQVVILGAGLDSFALRQPSELAGLRVYEVDHPSMQAWKLERLAALDWTAPRNTRFVPCDFEKTGAMEALGASDFKSAESAFISWMGVTYYLEKETIRDTLVELRERLAPGSEIAFDVMRPWDELPERYAEIEQAVVRYLKGAKEPQINRYRHDEIAETLEGAGFSRCRVDSREDLELAYRSKIGTKIPISERFRLIHAST